ncbi:MAG: serine hydrolase domain-containing protein [Anaerolineae bacterium]|jgi:CubicO group peptidase (beta-lactamase class C family)|nr:beta-lactamase family protein [Chloroflexota bacterium]
MGQGLRSLEAVGLWLSDQVPQVPAIATSVAVGTQTLLEGAWGDAGWKQGEPLLDLNTPFLVASLTKPVVCTGAMLLVQDGLLSLDEPVAEHLPAFGTRGKESITLRHLMTHTSGLPDQLANNMELRQQHAPLKVFLEHVCALEPLFSPGSSVRYQSMGLLVLGAVIEGLTGEPLGPWLDKVLFKPLGMVHTTLGMPAGGIISTVRANSSASERHSAIDTDWGWNSAYWRALGAPWGGLHSTATDLSRLLQHMLGELPGPLTTPARLAMRSDQSSRLPQPAAGVAPWERWGLGWRLGARPCGDLVSSKTFGHTGATGTLFWADPHSNVSCVLLTNRPDCHTLMARYSNAVVAALSQEM